MCQPLAIRPPKGPLLAASGSVWNVCGSNWLGEGDYLICLDRDSAKEVDVAFNIILKVPIGDRTQKWHSGIHCLNTRLSRAKPIGAGQMILGVLGLASGHSRSHLGGSPLAMMRATAVKLSGCFVNMIAQSPLASHEAPQAGAGCERECWF